MKVKIFLDDIRIPKQCISYMGSRLSNLAIYTAGWIVVRNYDEFVKAIDKYKDIEMISFDHDLAFEHYTDEPSTEKTGLDCARYFLENYHSPTSVTCIVHSFNPIGSENIRKELLKHLSKNKVLG